MEKHLIEGENGAFWNSVAVTDPQFTKATRIGIPARLTLIARG